MRKYLRYFIFTFSVLAIFYLLNNLHKNNDQLVKIERFRSTSSPKSGIEGKLGRAEYFNRMLRDPSTNQIPKNIRQKELSFAKKLREQALSKTNHTENLEWNEAGPNNVGGRTRAIAVDIANPNTIIAGGVSGGIWKSTDKGETWQMKSTSTQILSVTSISQDPRPGHTNTWYYGTGEFQGSAGDMAQSHIFTGDGIYKSIDNGETWNVLNSTYSKNTTRWDSEFDYVYKIIVNPATGSIFVAVQSEGIFKSSDGGNTFSLVIGGNANHYTSDIDIHSNGTIVAVLSTSYNDVTPQNSPGVYKSTDDGNNWTNITPNTFPVSHYRNLVEIAPSNPNTAYVLSFTWEFLEEKYDIVKFHKINISNGASEDRSQNMPLFNANSTDKFEEWINTQNGYNLALAIKPDDEDFVMIAATSLFRSTDGFATKLNNEIQDWIGGYNSITFLYPNFHCDIHSFAFEPNNPNAMWWGHDGGLSYTSNITNTSFTDFFPWENKNNGYNVTQFYMITQSNIAGDDRILGGTQDNGSPYFKWSSGIPGSSYDASSGDGAYAYLGTNYAYSSAQNGRVLRLHYDNMNNIVPPFTGDESKTYKDITPAEASNQLFINPFTVDPNNENVMYYLAGNVIWRNTQLNTIEDDWQRGTMVGWSKLDALTVPSGFVLSTLAISQSGPNHRLYYGASDYNQTPGSPKIYKFNNANTASNGAVEISIPNTASGSYVHHIAVNPDNADEIIVVLSNYNILGAYHSLNGGQTYSEIEGNLVGDENNPGPSIRSATILPTNEGTRYFLATSTGVYSASSLNGNNTNWSLEGAETIGNVVVNYITSRKSDGKIVAGTHGRGAFVAQAGVSGTAIAAADVSSLSLQAKPGETGSTSFNLKNDGKASLNYNISVTGSFLKKFDKQKSNSFVINTNKNRKIKSNRFSNRVINTEPKFSSAKLAINTSRNISNSINSNTGDNLLYLDDGDNGADNVFGWAYGASDIYCYNEFYLGDQSFVLDEIYFYINTNQALSNQVFVGVYDQEINALVEEYLSLPLAPTGEWFYLTLNSPIEFSAGEIFYIEIGSLSSIVKPIGVDIDAVVPNQSYYGDGFDYYNLNTVAGAENGAFLIRASGTLGGGSANQNPVAIANLSKTNAAVNESITFDASSSYDNDGEITAYLWNFGDGETSTQKSATHSYATANSYYYTLKVTDNKGGTDQTNGVVTITGTTNQYVVVNPASGSIAPGNSQKITLTLNAQNITEGTYTGQVMVSSNGGTITIPINYLVNIEKISFTQDQFSLSQNYPNPFNPTTLIEFSIPKSTNVSLKVYDMLGKEVATLLNENKSAGNYKIKYESAGLASGIYIYRIEADEFIDTKKLILLK